MASGPSPTTQAPTTTEAVTTQRPTTQRPSTSRPIFSTTQRPTTTQEPEEPSTEELPPCPADSSAEPETTQGAESGACRRYENSYFDTADEWCAGNCGASHDACCYGDKSQCTSYHHCYCPGAGLLLI